MGDSIGAHREVERRTPPIPPMARSLMETGWEEVANSLMLCRTRTYTHAHADTTVSPLSLSLSNSHSPNREVSSTEYQVRASRGSVPRLSEIDAALLLASLLDLHLSPCAHMAFGSAGASQESGRRFSPFGA